MCVFSFVLLGAHGSRLDYEFLITSHKVQLYLWTLGAHYYTSRLWVRNEIIISPARRRSINIGWMCAGGVADHAGVDLQLCAVRFSLSLSLCLRYESEWVFERRAPCPSVSCAHFDRVCVCDGNGRVTSPPLIMTPTHVTPRESTNYITTPFRLQAHEGWQWNWLKHTTLKNFIFS
jgi:hypothetical protein